MQREKRSRENGERRRENGASESRRKRRVQGRTEETLDGLY
jgi:hypothetical protein